MKRILTFLLALSLALSLAACGGKADDNKGKTDVTMTSQEILDTLKEKLGDSFECDVDGTEDSVSGYWGLDMRQVESWAAMSHSNSALDPSTAVILQVKDGYAQDAALLQTGYEQTLSYSRMYNMDLQKVLQARLFVNGNYVALLILGSEGNGEASDEEQAKFAAGEAAKVDAAWSGIFGSAENVIVIPEDDGSGSGGFFDMTDEDIDPELPDGSNDPQNDSQKDSADSAKSDSSNQNSKKNTADSGNSKKDDAKRDTEKKDTGKKDAAQDLSANDVLASLKTSLGSSYTSDTAETEARMSGYYGLDMSRIESWAAESNASSSLNADCAVVLKVKDGYAQDAAALLQQSFDQVVSYARMYDMDLQRVLQGRLYISGNYVALILEGAKPDGSASAEEQAKFAAGEAAKVDAAWKALFGSASNAIVIPAESASGNNGFDMSDGLEG